MNKLLVLVMLAAACGPSNRNNGDDDPTVDATPPECTNEGQYRCRASTWEQCANGMWMTEDQCPLACAEGLGCTECIPGQSICKDGNVWSCDATGKPGAETMVCGGETTCVNGACVDACEEAATSKSYISCEYWAVDLDNAVEVLGAIGMPVSGGTLDQARCTQASGTVQTMDICYSMQGQTVNGTAGLCDPPNTMGGAPTCPSGYTCGSQQACVLNAQGSPFAIVLSNPQSKIANVTITGPGGQTIMRAVDPGQVATVFPQMGGTIPDQSTDGTSKALKAYKIESSLPIVAYQFNPLDNVNVFSNDASLLIPRTTWDTDYYVMSYPSLDRRTVDPFFGPAPNHHFYGYLTIVAWEDGTEVTVTPKAVVQASTTMQSLAANSTTTFTLNAHEVLQLQAKPAAAPGGDLTGTHITSPNMKSFGVFGGTEASSFGETTAPDSSHTSGPCCADHLEEMMFPSSTWGKTFAIARSKQRTNESDVLRIMAQKPNTTITFTPAPVAGTCGTLGPGQFCSVKISGDTEIVASEPVLIGHYLQSSMWRDNPFFFEPTWVGTGDPSMAIAVPTEQYRKSYTILVPAQYEENYISISATSTGGVTVDNTAINLTAFPGGGTYRAARHPVSAGQHTITCADGCGITVYGYSDAVSYMFAGGLDLKPIVIF